MVGRNIEHYKIVEVLGEGGMGIVYKAYDLKLERYIAIKILNSAALGNPRFIARFKREAKNQAKLTHPNIVPVYGFTEARGILGIVMEYVHGETLEHMIERKGKLDLLESVEILKQILTGVAFAHMKGFVHRDIKPSNIIISTDGIVKIMDFGISKSLNEAKGLTKTGTKIGTILYMSPEQIKAQDPTSQSDIYSIGITFYEMLVGKTPFDFNTEYEIMEAHLKKNPPKISSVLTNIPADVDKIIQKALHKSTDKRYKTCQEFLDDLEQITGEKKIKKITKTKYKSFEKTTTSESFSNKVKFYLFAFVFIILFSGLVYFVYDTVSHFWKSNSNFVENIDDGRISYLSKSESENKAGWTKISSPTNNQLTSIFFIDESVGIACGKSGTILRTTDGGISWNTTGDSSQYAYYDIYFTSPSLGFLVGENGTLSITTDLGISWVNARSNLKETLFKIYFLEGNQVGFIVGAFGTVLKTSDSGKSWKLLKIPTKKLLYSISFSDSRNGIIVGWGGEVLKTSDQGETWLESEKFSENYLKDICFLNSSIGVAVGSGGEIYRTSDSGHSWESIKSGLVSGLQFVDFYNDHEGVILSNKGELLFTEDKGESWKIISLGNFVSLTDFVIAPSKKAFIVGGNGTILLNDKFSD